jgi:hypothetical protein
MGRAEGSLSRRSAEIGEIINWNHHGVTEGTEEKFFCLPAETGKQKVSNAELSSDQKPERFWRIVVSRFSRKPFPSVFSVSQASPNWGERVVKIHD